MNEYETVCVLQPDLAPARLDKVREKVQKILGDAQASVLNVNDWGKRKLAYRVDKYTFGHYLYFNYSGNGKFIIDLERALKYEEDVLRYLTVKMPKQVDADKPKKVMQLEETAFSFGDTRQSNSDY